MFQTFYFCLSISIIAISEKSCKFWHWKKRY